MPEGAAFANYSDTALDSSPVSDSTEALFRTPRALNRGDRQLHCAWLSAFQRHRGDKSKSSVRLGKEPYRPLTRQLYPLHFCSD
jgi:hypothetical protein